MAEPRRRDRRRGGDRGGHVPLELADKFRPFVDTAFQSLYQEVEEAVVAEVVEVSVLPEVLAAKVLERLEAVRSIEIDLGPIKLTGKDVGLTARWIAVPALVVFQAGLTAFIERVPGSKENFVRALRTLDPTGGLIGSAAAAVGKSADEVLEGFFEGTRGAMIRHLRQWSAIEDDAARAAAIQPFLQRWNEWKARIAAKLGAVAPVGTATPATTHTATAPAVLAATTTTPAAAGVRTNLMIPQIIMAMIANPAQKADGERARDIYRGLNSDLVALLNDPLLASKGELNGDQVVAAMLINDHTDYTRRHPVDPALGMVTPVEEALFKMALAAQRKAYPPAAPQATPATETVGKWAKALKDELPPGVSPDEAKQKGEGWRDAEADKLAQAQQPQPQRSSWDALRRKLGI